MGEQNVVYSYIFARNIQRNRTNKRLINTDEDIDKDSYCKEFTQVIVEAKNSQDLWLASWRLRVVMPHVRIPEREERRPPKQCNSQKGKFIADSSQGSCRIQLSGAGSESPDTKLLHKFIGWAHAVGSWFKQIGYKFAKQFHWSNTLKTFTRAGLSQGFLPRS